MSGAPVTTPLRILLIARHCGEPASGGSRRPLLMAQALERLGHRVTVVTPFDCPSLSDVIRVPLPAQLRVSVEDAFRPDGEAGQTIGAGAETIAAGVTQSRVMALVNRLLPDRLMAYLRLWKYFPDMDRLWADAVLDRLSDLDATYDWILTTSPPESLHFIGPGLRDRLGGRWCVELRDSWVDRSHRDYVRGLRGWAEGRCAARLLRAADAVIAVDALIAAEAARLSRGRTPGRVIGHYSDVHAGPVTALPDTDFNLVHAGGFTLSDRGRTLPPLIERLSALSQARQQSGRAPIRLHIAGRLSHAEAALCETTQDLRITMWGPLPLSDSRALQAGADALLLYSPEHSRALPGKYAEYALSGRPVVFLGPDTVQKMADTPEHLRALDELRTMNRNEAGPIETAFSVDRRMADCLDFLRSVTDDG